MKTGSKPRSAARKFSMVLASVLAIVALSLILPLSGLLMIDSNLAVAQSKADQSSAKAAAALAEDAVGDATRGFGNETNPRSNYWRAVREGQPGYSAIKGTDANVLINNNGQNWRAVRNGPISYFGWIALAIMAGAVILFALLRGQVKIEGGRSGVTVPRWNQFTRLLHWTTAITFLLLSATGLSLLYGRAVMIPLIGKDAFAAWASLAKLIHNWTGPVFGVTLVLMLLLLLPHNLPKRHDLTWFAAGGGMIGKRHPPAGRMNAGEKVWFWLLATFGVAIVVSGVFMNFVMDLSRGESQTAMIVHSVASLIVMAVAIGHIYIGTAGTEGSLEGMTGGEVDLNWARQHHDIWLDKLEAKGRVGAKARSVRMPPKQAAATGD